MADSASRRLSAATAARLLLAGWRPGRDVWGRVQLPHAFESFPEAQRVLSRFAGLRFGDRNDFAVLDPCAGEEEVGQIRQCERKVGRRMYPVGFAEHQDRAYYLVDEAGVVYLMFPGDELQPLASSFERALDSIARRSIRRRERDDDLRPLGLAGTSWTLEEDPPGQ
jgi:hypothetical protein